MGPSDLTSPHSTALRDRAWSSRRITSRPSARRPEAPAHRFHPASPACNGPSPRRRAGASTTVKTLADVLRQEGYTTALAGKGTSHAKNIYRNGELRLAQVLGSFVDHHIMPRRRSAKSTRHALTGLPQTHAADAVAHEAKRVIYPLLKPLFLYFRCRRRTSPSQSLPAVYDDRLQGRRRILSHQLTRTPRSVPS